MNFTTQFWIGAAVVLILVVILALVLMVYPLGHAPGI